jgi:hypothetical protein
VWFERLLLPLPLLAYAAVAVVTLTASLAASTAATVSGGSTGLRNSERGKCAITLPMHALLCAACKALYTGF